MEIKNWGILFLIFLSITSVGIFFETQNNINIIESNSVLQNHNYAYGSLDKNISVHRFFTLLLCLTSTVLFLLFIFRKRHHFRFEFTGITLYTALTLNFYLIFLLKIQLSYFMGRDWIYYTSFFVKTPIVIGAYFFSKKHKFSYRIMMLIVFEFFILLLLAVVYIFLYYMMKDFQL